MPQMPDVLEGKGYRFSGHTRDTKTESNCDCVALSKTVYNILARLRRWS
jgi:hypothetical protein